MKYARFWEGLDHAEEVLKLSNKNQELHLQYNKLIDNVNKLFDEQEKHVLQMNYHKILNDDNEGMEKKMNKKQLIISNLKNIQLAQAGLIKNLKEGNR